MPARVHRYRLAILSLLAVTTTAQQFTDATIAMVKSNLATAAQQSWELGTRAQALLELDAPSFSVFTAGSIPPPKSGTGALDDVLGIARQVVSALPSASAPRVLMDGAAGDSASLGIAVLLANATGAQGGNYAQAATDELDFLLDLVPRTSDGAISHHVEDVELWADFVYMVPPFLAYYGAMTGNGTLLGLAHTQCQLYRQYLHDKTNLWKHISATNSPDTAHWSTGNGWAAAGMLRVLATIANSGMADSFEREQQDLSNWVEEILDGMYNHLNRTAMLFPDYADSSPSFPDASSSALLAASTYRLSLLRSVHHHLPDAELIRKGLVARVGSDGWLGPVVNPESFAVQGSHSPEGQAFVLLLHSAWRDWVADGSQGANAAVSLRPTTWLLAAAVMVIALV